MRSCSGSSAETVIFTVPVSVKYDSISYYRDKLYELGLIGCYPNGIGYGNISCRINEQHQFFISGSGTGALKVLSPKHFSKVSKVILAQNSLYCEGPIIASSESMSHFAFYEYHMSFGM